MSGFRIDKLAPLSTVTLAFAGNLGEPAQERAIFIGVFGEGDERRARFIQLSAASAVSGRPTFEWEAYRYQGRWAYGSGADRLSVVSRDYAFEPVDE